MKSAALVLILAATPAIAAAPTPPPIPDGLYHCHTGTAPLILALGDVTIASRTYVLIDPGGHRSSGTYAATPLGYRWSGDFGAVKHDQLADSGPAPGGFDVRYALGHTSPVSIACRR